MKKRIPWNKGKKGVQIPWNKGLLGYLALNKHYKWNGGKRKTSQGYIEIKSPNHPFRNKQGYVPKHRLIAEKTLGRYLTKGEIIHHIDENPLNNKLKNLYLFAKRWQHAVYHRQVKRGKCKVITHSNIIKPADEPVGGERKHAGAAARWPCCSTCVPRKTDLIHIRS